jgi:hypothetical protein
MNRFYGDDNDEKVYGCEDAFMLTGAEWNAQWGGALSADGPEANVLNSFGVTFSQEASFDGWEGCCNICGLNLQMSGKITDGWFCEKDFLQPEFGSRATISNLRSQQQYSPCRLLNGVIGTSFLF